MNPTRVDPTKRLELISNRIIFLQDEIDELTKELGTLRAEQELLEGLTKLYSTTADKIDEERRVFEAPKQRTTHVQTDSRHTLILTTIEELFPEVATVKNIALLTELDMKQVYNAVERLKKQKLIATLGNGKYIPYDKWRESTNEGERPYMSLYRNGGGV